MRNHKKKVEDDLKRGIACVIKENAKPKVDEDKDKADIPNKPPNKKAQSDVRFEWIKPYLKILDKCRKGTNEDGDAKSRGKQCRKTVDPSSDCICAPEEPCKWKTLTQVPIV